MPDEEIVKGYEIRKGEYVHVTDEDFAAAKVEGYRTIAIEAFVAYEEIDPIYFERTYYLGPAEGAERVYALLLRAMERSELAGIARYVMRNREHLGCLRIREGVITLEKMYFADEIRPIDEIEPRNVEVAKQELEMAADLIDRFTSKWKPESYDGHLSRAAARGDQGEEEGQGGPRRRCRGARRPGRPLRGAARERRGRQEVAQHVACLTVTPCAHQAQEQPQAVASLTQRCDTPWFPTRADDSRGRDRRALRPSARRVHEGAQRAGEEAAQRRRPRRGRRCRGPPEAVAPRVARQPARSRAPERRPGAPEGRRRDQERRRRRGRAVPRVRRHARPSRRGRSSRPPAASRRTRCCSRSRRRFARLPPRRRRILRRAG